MRKKIIFGLIIVSLIIINFSIYKKEQLLKHGEVVFIETVPRDPRSYMQGDYHILRYRLPTAITSVISKIPRKGFLVLVMNDKKIGTITSVYQPGQKLDGNQKIIQYRIRSRGIRIGAESFFFQEKHGKYYNRAKYGELRLATNGHSLLVALRDAKLNKMGPPIVNK